MTSTPAGPILPASAAGEAAATTRADQPPPTDEEAGLVDLLRIWAALDPDDRRQLLQIARIMEKDGGGD